MEVDHVYIDDDYRGKGLGKQFLKWEYNSVSFTSTTVYKYS